MCGRNEIDEALSWMPRGCTGFCVLLPFKTKLTPINSPMIFFFISLIHVRAFLHVFCTVYRRIEYSVVIVSINK